MNFFSLLWTGPVWALCSELWINSALKSLRLSKKAEHHDSHIVHKALEPSSTCWLRASWPCSAYFTKLALKMRATEKRVSLTPGTQSPPHRMFQVMQLKVLKSVMHANWKSQSGEPCLQHNLKWQFLVCKKWLDWVSVHSVPQALDWIWKGYI